LVREVLIFAGPASAVFESAGIQPALADDNPVRDADQLHVCELDPGARIAIIPEDVEAELPQLIVEQLAGCGGTFGFVHVQRYQRDVEWGDGGWPDDAPLIGVLLDSGGNDARDADSIAAHGRSLAVAVGIEDGAVHFLAVGPAQLKDVADFDSAGD